ncbi:uncharacterized protein LOC119299832 [Triticum dicoccoides]|uniref:uncharacterized protein LOC119299832 n=1 Tax=Triticum dicoccoides TaxID=85692 RepID=UPI00188FC633|nr:uncharacterized protein LOC119299832 [Triticum dicoccoides]
MEDVGAAAATQQGGHALRAESPTRSAQSTGRVNPQAPGWTKRLRLGSAPPDRVPCPSRMSALEISIRKYAEQPDKSVVKPELGLSFDSLGEAFLLPVLLGLYGSGNNLGSPVAVLDCKSMPRSVPSRLMLRSKDLLVDHPPAVCALELKETSLTGLPKEKRKSQSLAREGMPSKGAANRLGQEGKMKTMWTWRRGRG